ncbi:MAG TPA: VCBS repeat-containing protein, partial [Herpetosiphonaceae bacterium]|nr:VCBS repeat-containing protein [Herpetosiphonaceae bacterium]
MAHRSQRPLARASLILITILAGLASLPRPRPAFAATTFSKLGVSLTAVVEGDLDWGDYDNDGDLDFILSGTTGSATTQIWRNNGDSTFTQAQAPTGVWASATAWGDYDNDGDLDFVLAGWSGSAFTTELWRNNGNGAFSAIS